MNHYIQSDILIFKPDDVDLSFSPMRKSLHQETYVLGAFNPGLCRLKNGNLLMMVRVAEALKTPVAGNKVCSIRWDPEDDYTIDERPIEQTDIRDPRKIKIRAYEFPCMR